MISCNVPSIHCTVYCTPLSNAVVVVDSSSSSESELRGHLALGHRFITNTESLLFTLEVWKLERGHFDSADELNLRRRPDYLDVFIPGIYQIFRASQNANRWRIINQMFAKSQQLDAWEFFFLLEASEVTSSGRRLKAYTENLKRLFLSWLCEFAHPRKSLFA